MKIPGVDHFVVQEFLHPSIYNYVNRNDGIERWRWYVSRFQLEYAVLLREVLAAPITINTWHKGGNLVGRGTRPINYRPKGGAIFSQHYLSNALDVSSPAYTPVQILSKIEANWDRFALIGCTTFENPKTTKTWLHGDGRARVEGLHPADGGWLVVEP